MVRLTFEKPLRQECHEGRCCCRIERARFEGAKESEYSSNPTTFCTYSNKRSAYRKSKSVGHDQARNEYESAAGKLLIAPNPLVY